MKPVIGVLPLVDEERESLWMLPGYMEGITMAGGLPLMLPLTDDPEMIGQIVDLCDGFLFTGGHDVSPEIYAAAPDRSEILRGSRAALSDGCGMLQGEVCPEQTVISSNRDRDNMELRLLEEALKRDKPVFGICRGIQFLNAALGGKLYQDLPMQHPSQVEHHQTPPYDEPVHAVDILQGSPLWELLKKDSLMVNSYHHQAVRELAPCLKEMAVSTDGLIEAVYKPDQKFVWAVQWHPEFSYKVSGESRELFRQFVRACAE